MQHPGIEGNNSTEYLSYPGMVLRALVAVEGSVGMSMSSTCICLLSRAGFMEESSQAKGLWTSTRSGEDGRG